MRPNRFSDNGGFTLIEVLVAMVILAIGLLGLQALGIGTARAIALGQIQTEYAIAASGVIEETSRDVTRRPAELLTNGGSTTEDEIECGERICLVRTVITPVQVNEGCREETYWRTVRFDIEVTVEPPANQNLPWGSIDYDVASELFIPFSDGNC